VTASSQSCRDLDEHIDAVAGGDLTDRAQLAIHLPDCAHCQTQLALARRIDGALATREPPAAAAGLAAMVERRLRRDWWKAEQFIDVVFNLAVVAGLGAVAIGIWLLLELSGLTVVTSDASDVVLSGVRSTLAGVSPRLSMYTLALLFVLTTIVVWWWVDRESAG
jgi:hypothetical protein